MNNSPLETFYIGDKDRVKLYPECFYTDLEDLTGELAPDRGVYIFPTRRFATLDVGALDVAYMLCLIECDFADYEFKLDERIKHTESTLSADIRQASYLSMFATLRGYSQGDEWRVLVYLKEGEADNPELVMAHLMGAVKTWLVGNVYSAVHEHLDTWTNSDGESREMWTEVDSLGMVTPDDVDAIYPSELYLAEMFDIAYDAEPGGDH